MTLTPVVLTDCRIYYDSVDLTGFSNHVEGKVSVEDEDKTTFASGGWKERTAGLFDSEVGIDGLWDAGDLSKPDDTFWANLGTSTKPLTLVPKPSTILVAPTVGDLSYLTRVLETTYEPGGDVGKLLSWSAGMKGNWPLVRGAVLHPQGTARSTSANGTALQIGALSATQALYVTLHVLSVSGTSSPTITVAIESDNASNFPSTTTQGTFTAATAIGGQTMKISGAVTDDYWRAVWTITGSTPSFLFAVSAGIGPK